MMEVGKIKEKALDYWHFYYCEVIPIIITVVIIAVERKCKIKFWNAQNFADMLTALITFLSIVLSIYSFLIPSFVSAKEDEKVKNFLANADMELFIKNIKKIFIEGIITLVCVCSLFLYDIINTAIYVKIMYISVFFMAMFCCRSYRFIGIIIDLLIETKKGTPKSSDRVLGGKKYNNKVNEFEKERIDKKLLNK